MSFGKRSWVKLWVNEWLDGTTRYQLTDSQRVFWIDLLAMAGRSRFPGIVCSGKDGNQLVGYPLNRFQSLMAEPLDIEATLALFERTGKIKLQLTSDGPPKLFAIHLLNWNKYQSEYQRVKKYRDTAKVQRESQARSQAEYGEGHTLDVEVDSDGDSDSETRTTKAKGSVCAFDENIKAYPEGQRRNLKRSRELFAATVKNGDHKKFREGLERWKASDQWTRGFIPNLDKFLEDELWRRDPPPPARKEPGDRDPGAFHGNTGEYENLK